MARVRAKVENKTTIWVANSRPRVGSATIHKGFYWTNTTGINSEPGVGDDWVRTGAIESLTGLIRISGYSGYLTDNRDNGIDTQMKAGNFFYGEGQFYPGEYIIGYSLIDDPVTVNDIAPIHRYLLPALP